MTFEKSLARLEQIVRELESTELTLDVSLALFEEGIRHLRAASEALATADASVKQLTERTDGILEITEFRA